VVAFKEGGMVSVPLRQVRARFTDDAIVVYQAYSAEIASPAVTAGRFVPPFKRERMTWVKPSFLWMMYRSGWGSKPGQERVLAVEITRAGFEWALAHACLSHFDPAVHADRKAWSHQLHSSPARVQWDPERSLQLESLPYRSLQLGLSGEAVDRYVDDWIVSISDVTSLAQQIRTTVRGGDAGAASALLPTEQPYPLTNALSITIAATPSNSPGVDAAP
jgi:hypothetical protein